MGETRTIKAKRIVSDVRARLSDADLLARYDLTDEQLQQVLERLVKAGILRRAEVTERGERFDDPANRCRTRRFSRQYLRLPLFIQDVVDADKKGFVTDLSEQGFRARAIATSVGDEKVFLIGSTEITDVGPIVLRATCKWTKTGNVDSKLDEAGFEITDVSQKNLKGIQKLIKVLSLGDCNLARRPK